MASIEPLGLQQILGRYGRCRFAFTSQTVVVTYVRLSECRSCFCAEKGGGGEGSVICVCMCVFVPCACVCLYVRACVCVWVCVCVCVPNAKSLNACLTQIQL